MTDLLLLVLSVAMAVGVIHLAIVEGNPGNPLEPEGGPKPTERQAFDQVLADLMWFK